MNSDDQNKIVVSPSYSGGSVHSPLSNDQIILLTSPDRSYIHGQSLFALKYRVLPCYLKENNAMTPTGIDDFMVGGMPQMRGRRWIGKRKPNGMFHATSVKEFLIKEYGVNPDTFIYEMSYDIQQDETMESVIYIDLGGYLSVEFNGGFFSPNSINNPNDLKADKDDNIFICYNNLIVYHIPQSMKDAKKLLGQLSKMKLYPVTEATLQMVCYNAQRGFYTSTIRMKKPHIADLKLHYGDDFPEIHEELLEMLEQKDSTGITFLHGPPGTGKTFYLRYLINEVKNKNLIYVPPDLVNDISKPGFLPFLMQHPNTILIVEDAENIIRDRSKDTIIANQAVSNLLNLSDGLLGDAMHQQIICTFNCDVSGIDPALLREGRLIVEHKFEKLSIENARRLCRELNIPGNGENIYESTSLAEIYARKNASDIMDSDADIQSNGKTTTRRPYRKKTNQSDKLLSLYS